MGVEDLSTETIENLLGYNGHIWFEFTDRDLTRQPKRPLQTYWDVDADLGQEAEDHVHQQGALFNQKIAYPMHRQCCCCSVDFFATKRMVGRVTGSQIASASTASFLLRFT